MRPQVFVTVTVVVPVGPIWRHLHHQLRALAAQNYVGDVQVVLSCNGSPRVDVMHEAQSHRWAPGWSLEVVDSSSQLGPSSARNAGWAVSQSDVVLFCDADDVVHSSWVRHMVASLASADVVAGRIEHDALSGTQRATWGALATRALPNKFTHLAYAPGGNLGVRHEVLRELGGFHTGLLRGEDVDFSWRAQYAGYSLQFEPRAVVSVRRRESCRELYAQARADGLSDVELLRLHGSRGAGWSLRDLAREWAGVAVAGVHALWAHDGRLKVSSRFGRVCAHSQQLRQMLGATRVTVKTGRRCFSRQ